MEDAPVMTAEEVAALLRVRADWVYEMARRGVLPSYKLGKFRRFARADVLTWLHERRDGAYKQQRRTG